MDVLERVGVGLGAYRCCFLALWGQTDISGLVLSGVSTRRAVRGYQPGRAELTEMAAGTARAATQKTGSCLKDRHRSQTATRGWPRRWRIRPGRTRPSCWVEGSCLGEALRWWRMLAQRSAVSLA
jgi:hypothetical protein